MQLETFRGSDLSHVLGDVRRSLGDGAMIIETRRDGEIDGENVEITATTSEAVEEAYRRFGAGGERARGGSSPDGPTIIALVGPTGAGKTLTAAKLALNSKVFGSARTALMSLDTYRPAGFEPLSVYADVAGVPLEVLYHPDEADDALRRLSSADAVIVDTPGRSPRSTGDEEWKEILKQIEPHEVHLVLPAHLRRDVADQSVRDFSGLGLTHLLLSKVDEVPDDGIAASLAMSLDLPGRWLTTGQDVPGDIEACGPRILGSLGLKPESGARVGSRK